MNYSKSGLALTERFECCELKAYPDVRGVWTIGWGHTGPDVHAGLVWTQAQADAQLASDTAYAAHIVNTYVTATLTQGEFDALVDFTFNVGKNAFRNSSMVRFLNAGDMAAAAAQFDRWECAGGKVVAGLLRRREAEEAEFENA